MEFAKNTKGMRNTMKLKIKRLTETAKMPTRGTEESAGLDLYIDSDKAVYIPPHTTVMLQTGIAVEIPKGHFGAIYPRSGISSKRGVRLANCVGVIDADYRGNVGMPLHNDTEETVMLMPYERVAQMIITAYPQIEIEETTELTTTPRGEGGFGSTGK